MFDLLLMCAGYLGLITLFSALVMGTSAAIRLHTRDRQEELKAIGYRPWPLVVVITGIALLFGPLYPAGCAIYYMRHQRKRNALDDLILALAEDEDPEPQKAGVVV